MNGLYLKVLRIVLYGVVFSFLIISCGVTKRHYRSGFYFPRHASFETSGTAVETELPTKQVLTMLPENSREVKPTEVITDDVKELEPVECSSKQKLSQPVFVYTNTKKIYPETKITRETELREEPVSENNTELARWYAGRAMRYAIITLCFCWTGYALFIFGPLALNRAKHALFLNDEGDEQIKVKAQRAQKIVSFCFTLASIAVLLLIMLFILSL